MENWQNEAKFVQEEKRKEDMILFREDDSEHTGRAEHDRFVDEWGFSYNDVWDLDRAAAMFILPRLAYYKDHCDSYPVSFARFAQDGCTILNEEEAVKAWKHILETICRGFHLYIEKDKDDYSDEENELWSTAKKYLFDYYEMLWS